MNKSTTCAAALLILAASATSRADVLTYEIESVNAVALGTFGGLESYALDINDLGEVVGQARNASDWRRGFLHRNGSMQDITDGLYAHASARAINNASEVVGSYGAENGLLAKPFRWTENTGLMDLTLPSGDAAWPHAINNAGHIVGNYAYGWQGQCNAPPVEWLDAWSPVGLLFCGVNSTSPAWANDINDSGAIVGTEPFDDAIAWVWSHGIKQIVPKPAVPNLADPCDMVAEGINAGGDVVGGYKYCGLNAGTKRAFIWDGESLHSEDIGVLPTGNNAKAFEINDQRFVAGYGDRIVPGLASTGHLRERAFIWHANLGMKTLPVPAGFAALTNCRAVTINNRISSGLVQLAGHCTVGTYRRAVRWDVVVVRRNLSLP